MKHISSRNIVVLTILAATFIYGCTPMTEVQREARDYSRAEFRLQFIEDRAECQGEGRRMFVSTFGGGVDRDGIPKTRTRYFCS